MDEKRPDWTSGRVRESADGLRGRPSEDEREQRLREAEEREVGSRDRPGEGRPHRA